MARAPFSEPLEQGCSWVSRDSWETFAVRWQGLGSACGDGGSGDCALIISTYQISSPLSGDGSQNPATLRARGSAGGGSPVAPCACIYVDHKVSSVCVAR